VSEGRDIVYMRRAIELARAHLGRTWPNPPVGCVLVKDGVVIAEAATGDGGRPHAEEAALVLAGAAARGATAYVTLEPCGERSTGAASCSQRLIEAGVAQVIYACADPSPFASHKGVQRMLAAGLHPDAGLLADEAGFLIAGFVHWLKTSQPLVVARTDHVDALFAPEGDDLDAELTQLGARGYRLLGVAPDGELARRLRAEGRLCE
jgi:pyrimidine deaminase RibD-like protein